MTNTEAFNEAMKFIDTHKDWSLEPVGFYNIPMKVIYIYCRICDFHANRGYFPKSYRNLHAWEKNYYGEK